jgi:hypothetical protein
VLGYWAERDVGDTRTWVVWDTSDKVLQQAVNQRLKDGTHRLVVFGRDAHGQLVPVDGRDIDQHFKERRLPAAELQRIQSSTRRENDLDPGGTAPTAPHSRAEP